MGIFWVGAAAFYVLCLSTLMISFMDFCVDAHEVHSSSQNLDFLHTKHKRYSAAVQETLNDFSSHIIIKPKIYHGRTKKVLFSTLDDELENGSHLSHVVLSYKHNGKNVISDLYLEENIIPDGHFLRIQSPNQGQDIIKNFTKTDLDLCHYQGKVRGSPNSKVAISTCNGGIKGVVFDGSDTYMIHSGQNGRLHDEHFLLKQEDFLKNGTCGYKNHHDDNDKKVTDFRFKRSISHDEADVIRGPYNANKHSSYVELVIVVDNKISKAYGGNIKNIHKHCQDIANIVNALYVPLNIFIALVGVVVWNEKNEIDFNLDGDVTLRNFLTYRKTKLVVEHPNDNAQLLTKETFNAGVVGKALKGPICTFEYSGGVSVEHSNVDAVVATTMAHEMGHNFGMEHDNYSDCKCPEQKCIMSESSTSVLPKHWSSCSIDQLNFAFSKGMNYCLRNKPTKLVDSPRCGNGFVEPGEQCDCGYAKNCKNNCCDPYTCMLYKNASCATGECCDLNTCRPKLAGSECRAAESECDLPEYCTGESEYCPSDVFKRDTEPCDEGNAFCYEGDCRSHSSQCKVLWGQTGENSEHCYDKNIEGNRHGNCAYDRFRNVYIRCNQSDVMCGMLHCRHLNERLEFGMETVAILSHSFMNYGGNIIPCRTAIVDLGLESIDPGLTPNGAKCGDDKMCVHQKCLAIEELNARGIGVPCRDDCSGNGICNSRGHCHCFDGFGGEICNDVGNGGSVDSGPASNPSRIIGFTRILYIFFLGVVPTIALVLLLLNRRQLQQLIQKKEPTSPTTVKVIKSNSQNHHPPPSNGVMTSVSSPSSTDDMNSALLKSPSDADGPGMFGKFKGFTLLPLQKEPQTPEPTTPNVAFVQPITKDTQPTRAAPPVPLVKKSSAPSLPPPNKGSNARPLISNPVLENSTCPAAGSENTVPSRPAPTPPVLNNTQNNQAGTTLKRIKSLLKKEEPPVVKIKPTIDKEKLKNIEISAPIPISESITSNLSEESKDSSSSVRPLLNRTQSMKSPTKSQTTLKSFGSMRYEGRPKSTAQNSCRPKSPPPRPPAPKVTDYQSPIEEHMYDDCEAVETASVEDNIYSVIDEKPKTTSSALDNTSLLGEIVNEIEKRNVDSIYAASTINKNKSPATTSKGAPIARVAPTRPAPTIDNNKKVTPVKPKPLTKPAAVGRNNSHVARLQQKFENK